MPKTADDYLKSLDTKDNFISQWGTFKVGDLITAYHKGYFRIIGIQERPSMRPLIHYSMVLDSKFRPRKKFDCCDVNFCMVITQQHLTDLKFEAVEKMLAYSHGLDKLKDILKVDLTMKAWAGTIQETKTKNTNT